MSFDVDRVSEEMKLNVRQMFQVQQRRGGSRHKKRKPESWLDSELAQS